MGREVRARKYERGLGRGQSVARVGPSGVGISGVEETHKTAKTALHGFVRRESV